MRYDPFGRLFTVFDGDKHFDGTAFSGFGDTDPWDTDQSGNPTGDPLLRYRYWDNNWNHGTKFLDPSDDLPFLITTLQRPGSWPKPADSSGGYAYVSQAMHDGFGRQIQTRDVWAEIDGQPLKREIYSTTNYNALGQVACQTAPYDLPYYKDRNGTWPYGIYDDTLCMDSSLAQTTTTYDELGRVRYVTAPDGSFTQHIYAINDNTGTVLFHHNIVDANQHRIKQSSNSLGQLVQVTELSGNCGNYWGYSCDTGEQAWAEDAVTTYDYDLFGNLEIVTDTKGITTTMTYDNFGRKTDMDDPDMGEWEYEYDALGNLRRQTDANGNILCFEYDVLGRLLSKGFGDTGDPCTIINELAGYEYDTAPYGIGQLAEVTWSNGSDSFEYDALGRMDKQVRLLDGRSYTMETTDWDALHRPETVVYPNGEEITLTYDHEGENSLQAGIDLLVDNIAYNEHGQMKQFERGNGIDTIFSYYNAIGTGGESNFRLDTIQHGGLGDDDLSDFTFSYDWVGNITDIVTTNDNTITDTQTFTYDHLNRLDTAWGGATSNLTAYNHAYGYDKVGNIDWIDRGSGVISYTYAAEHPHAVTLAGDDHFTYDANGNMTSREDGNDVFTQIFDAENRLVAVARVDDAFDTKDTAAWTFNDSYQTIPFNLNGDNVIKNVGTGTGWDANFNRNGYSLSDGSKAQIAFQLSTANQQTDFMIETAGNWGDTNYNRLNLYSQNNKLFVQEKAGTASTITQEIINEIELNKWYVLTFTVDDIDGIGLNVYQQDFPSRQASYTTTSFPAGQSWQFKNAHYSGTIYVDDYSETFTEFEYDTSGIRTKTIEPDGTVTYTPFPNYEDEEYTVVDGVIGEVGQVTALTHVPQTIVLNQSFKRPVVFAQPLSRIGETATVRITDVQADRFTLYVQEPPDRDGLHLGAETVSYIVLEAGSWTLANGAKLEVGLDHVSEKVGPNFANSWHLVNFNSGFTAAPVVISQVQSNHDPSWVKTRHYGTSATGFNVTLEGADSATTRGAEQVGWLAMSSGNGSWNNHLYEAGQTPDAVTHNWFNLQFTQNFTQPPRFAAAITAYDGADASHLRYDSSSLTAAAISIMVEEDTTVDTEVAHTTETVSYLAIEGDGLLTGSGSYTIQRTTYSVAGQAVAVRVSGDPAAVNNGLSYLYSDHLGSASAMQTTDGSVTQTRYMPFGGYRTGSGGNDITDRGYTGHKQNDGLGLIYMNARYYVPYINRFLSADTIVPDPANPQSWNRYSYVFNSPLNYIDPSGHDPLDAQWQADFEAVHNRAPDSHDRLIRLFSIAFPDEWDWNAFYDENGMLHGGNDTVLKEFLKAAPESRNWENLPDALARLSEYYERNETEEFARDIGTLFAGLPDRFTASTNLAVTGCEVGIRCENPITIPAAGWAHLQPKGMPSHIRGDDKDANVHHWAWGVTLGYHYGVGAVAMNTVREIQTVGGIGNLMNNSNSKADVFLGNRGAFFGSDLDTFGPRSVRFLYSIYVAEW